MSESSNPRPTHTTLAAWLTVSASVFLVISLFTSIPALRTLESRRTWEEALAEPGLGALGLDIEQVLTGLYVMSLVAAACATAAAILGVFVLRGDRQARLALSVVAVPLFLAGFLTGGLLSAVVAVAVVMLWLQPSRDWFDGKAPAPATSRGATPPRSSSPPGPPPTPPQHDGSSPAAPGPAQAEPLAAPAPWGRPVDQPSDGRAHPGFGDAPGTAPGTAPGPAAGPAPGHAPGGVATDERAPWTAGPQTPTGPPAPTRRPPSVVLACVSAWIFSSIAVVLFGASIAVALASPDELMGEVVAQDPALADAGLTTGTLVTAAAVTGGVLVIWSVAALVLATLAFRGSNGARIALVVSAALVAVPGALMSFFAPTLLPVVLAAVVTIYGLVRPDARAWYAARARGTRPGAPGPGGQWG